MELYFTTDMTLDAMAETLRRALNIPPHNATPHLREQKRFGMNRGGEYYLFEAFGVQWLLLSNKGETRIEERPNAAFYLYGEGGANTDSDLINCLTRQILSVTQRAGLHAEADGLTA